MKATLYLTSGESTPMIIELPEAAEISAMRAQLNVYSNIDHVLWQASIHTASVEHVSTSPDPAHSLSVLATKLRSELAQQAATVTLQ